MTTIEEDPRWVVEVTTGERHEVGAAMLKVEGGCLVFLDDLGDVLVAYSAGRWIEVNR